MPLRDHFRPPLHPRYGWETTHAAWLGSIADVLNRTLPPGYFAADQRHAGAAVEIDVATFEITDAAADGPDRHPGGNGVAVAARPAAWAPPAPAATVPAAFADDFELRVVSELDGLRLVAAVEMVSPRNKDRPDARRAFAAKCASYLYQGVSVVVVDVVTTRGGNLQHGLADLLGIEDGPGRLPAGVSLYAAAHRPVRRAEREEIEVWPEPLAVGSPLPTLPLWIDAVTAYPIDLEATYTDACRRRRIPG